MTQAKEAAASKAMEEAGPSPFSCLLLGSSMGPLAGCSLFEEGRRAGGVAERAGI